jgi:FkbM family methyltransferase
MNKLSRLLVLVTPQWLKDKSRNTRMFARHKIPFIAKLFSKYYGLNNLDEKLEKYLNWNHGYFVELGANDGLSQSNTKYFELFRNWSGVLVEPYPENFQKCKKNRSRHSKVFNFACVGFDFKQERVRLAYSNLMTVSLDGRSDIEDKWGHAHEGNPFLNSGEVVHEFSIEAITLNEILITADSPKEIDLLSLDVEGAELEVLSGIDHKCFRFKYICLESRDLYAVTEYLLVHNYEFVESLSKHDYLFKNMEK